MKKVIYHISMILTVADIIGIALFALMGWYAVKAKRMYGVVPFLVIGGAAACIVLMPLIDKLRRYSRNALKYDDYGRMKAPKRSVQEQKELDKQRLLMEEKLLPSSLVQEMTKKGSEDPEKELNDLIGLPRIKEDVAEMEARLELDSGKKKKDGEIFKSHHMVFFGPPGTGKTTVAAIMSAYLKKYGIIQRNQLIVTSGGFLSGNDKAALLTEALVRKSFGGVLFIDEAYALYDGPYGKEVVASLIQQMEDHRDKFVLILAGYEEEMRRLLKSNPGFLSRFANFLFFENYSDDEMLEIFKNMARKDGYWVSEEAEQRIREVISLSRKEHSFGNARTARAILERSINRHALNVKKGLVQRDTLDDIDIVFERNPLAK